MLFRYTTPTLGAYSPKILHGNDTDVSFMTIVKMNKNQYVVVMNDVNEETGESNLTSRVWTLQVIRAEFDEQYGTPMQYMSQEDFEWLTI